MDAQGIVFLNVWRAWLAVASSVKRLATGWTVRGSNPGGWARFSTLFQTGPDAHAAFYDTVGTASFPGG